LTYHGPGQLVAYPIINLRPLDQEDGALSVRCFVDRLEQIMIDVLSARGVQATRLDGQPGVYVGDGMKIGSIGVHVSRFITSHGLALNCERQTESWFRNIVVCGRQDNRVTSMAAQVSLNGENSNQLVSVDCTLPLMIDSFSRRFQRPLVPLEQIDPHLNRWIDIIL
jgi:lipoyl(octanoyl) transferase